MTLQNSTPYPQTLERSSDRALQLIQRGLTSTSETLVEAPPLREFVVRAWREIDPDPFKGNWHVDVVCDVLEALTNREIQRVVFNLPPGLAKSLLVSVMWPAWEWIEHPGERYLYSSYSSEISGRDTKKSRDIIQSAWYQEEFGASFRLLHDQNTKTYYENDRRGFRKATSVGGSATGTRARTLVLDDPHKLEDFGKQEAIAGAVDHKNTVLGSRGRGDDTRKVIMQQRIDDSDCSGDTRRKMEQGGEHYEFVVLPMRHKPSVQLDMMQYNRLDWLKPRSDGSGAECDPRRIEGQLLHKDLYSDEETTNQEINQGDKADAVLGQDTRTTGGKIFKPLWWDPELNPTRSPHVRYDPLSGAYLNSVWRRYLVFDTNFKDKETSSYAACVVLEVQAGTYRVHVREVVREQLVFPDLLAFIEEQFARWSTDGLIRHVVIEDRASGISALQTLKRTADPNLSSKLVGFAPPGSKDEKCKQAAIYCRLGLVPLPYPSEYVKWLSMFEEEELYAVPTARFRDMSDAFSLGILYLQQILTRARRLLQKQAA